jgi:hypothetical protein
MQRPETQRPETPRPETQRPETPFEAAPPASPALRAGGTTGYSGPPRADPPPRDWHPTVVPQPPPPRMMPAQDMDALDEDEGAAKTVTYGIGLVAGAIAVILFCLLGARILF